MFTHDRPGARLEPAHRRSSTPAAPRRFLIGAPEHRGGQGPRVDEELGGIDRITLQMTNVRLAHEPAARIELLGTEVAPLVRETLAGERSGRGST